jgi:hypothetical protein
LLHLQNLNKRKLFQLENNYNNKQGNKIELEEQEELVPNVNKVDSKNQQPKNKDFVVFVSCLVTIKQLIQVKNKLFQRSLSGALIMVKKNGRFTVS